MRNGARKIGVKSSSLNAIMNNVFVIADKKFHGFDRNWEIACSPRHTLLV